MTRVGAILLALGVFALLSASASADDVRPATLRIESDVRDLYTLRWQTPMRGNATLRMTPRLPDGAERVAGSYERALMGDSLVETWRFTLPGGLAGREVGVQGPAINVRSVVVTVDLGAGVVHRAILSGARTSMLVPEPVLTEPPYLGTRIADQAMAGDDAAYALAIFLFAFALATLMGFRGAGWPLLAFLVAQILGGVLPVPRLAPAIGDAAVALAAAVLLCEAWRGTARRVVPLAAVAGLAWGLAKAPTTGALDVVSWAMGMDGLVILFVFVMSWLLGLVRKPTPAKWLLAPAGIAAVAVALVGTLAPSPRTTAEAASAPIAPMALVGAESATPAQVRDVDGMDVFLDIGVFETRVEVLARLDVLVSWLDVPLPPADPDMPGPPILRAEQQAAWLDAATRALGAKFTTSANDEPLARGASRAAFTTRDAAGVYLREEAVDEDVADAVVGFVFFHPTPRIPYRVHVAFEDLPAAALRARTLDPEVSREEELTQEEASIWWESELRDDPLPPIEAVALRRVPVGVPVVAIGFVLLGLILAGFGSRIPFMNGEGWMRIVVLRLLVSAALLMADWSVVPIPGLDADVPVTTTAEQRAVTQSLLDNVYRAFNERGEEEVYDRLALSLAGDRLQEAYVENRRILEERRFGGARTHVDVVELHDLTNVRALEGVGFEADATWTVAGTVTHFGHRHLRRNRYEARLEIAPVGEAWKIRTLDVRGTTRVR